LIKVVLCILVLKTCDALSGVSKVENIRVSLKELCLWDRLASVGCPIEGILPYRRSMCTTV
jgi:hypothetical protein